MEITATELKNNLGKYLKAARHEDVIITKNGAPIARLTSCQETQYSYSGGALTETLGMIREPAFTNNYNTERADDWLLSYNGEPVARLAPVKKKRILGFVDGPPASPETIAALFEPNMTEEELDEWENQIY